MKNLFDPRADYSCSQRRSTTEEANGRLYLVLLVAPAESRDNGRIVVIFLHCITAYESGVVIVYAGHASIFHHRYAFNGGLSNVKYYTSQVHGNLCLKYACWKQIV